MKKTKTKNRFEERLFDQLKKLKVKVKYESEKIPYVLYRNYIPDFIIEKEDGKILYIEAKGYFRPDAKPKMVAVKKLHPDLDIRFVFYNNNKSNIRWAMKHGFPYSIGYIPEEWLL